MTDEEIAAQALSILTAFTHGLDDIGVDLIDELDRDDLVRVTRALASFAVGFAIGTDLAARRPVGTTLERGAYRWASKNPRPR